METTTIIVGAGPAGLATAACLRERGVEFTLLEAGEKVGWSWRHHYERLHLHTARDQSSLPISPFPREFPTYPSREQVVEYLDEYAHCFDIEPRFGARVERVTREDGRWRLQTTDGELECDNLVVATGYNGIPVEPDFEGLDDFAGSVTHSRHYFSGRDYAGKTVLVVGCGNSGAEIAIDLFECGAKPLLVIRSPTHVQPRDFLGIPVQRFSLGLQHFPRRVADAIGVATSKMLYPDLEDYGIVRPDKGPVTMIEEDGRVPMIDIGTIDLIRQGVIVVVPGIRCFTEHAVEFVDGTTREVDDVVLATGYRSGLGEWLDAGPGVLDDRGLPTGFADDAPAPGLFFVGFRNPATGQFHDIALEAPRVADAIREDTDG